MSSLEQVIDLEYRLDRPCTVDLVGVALVARGQYVAVTPETVALRLMEDRRDGVKQIGVVMNARQSVDNPVLEYTLGSQKTVIPGKFSDVHMTIQGRLFPEVVAEDWQDIRPDLSLKDFKGILVSCQVNCAETV